MKKLAFVATIAALLSGLTSCEGQKKSDGKLTNEIDSVSYSIGADIGNNLKKNQITGLNLEMMMKGMKDAFDSALVIPEDKGQACVTKYLQNEQKKKEIELNCKNLYDVFNFSAISKELEEAK